MFFFYKQYMTMESESGNYQNLGAAVVIEEGRFHTIIIGEGKKSQGLIKLLVYLLSIFFKFKYLYEHFFSDFSGKVWLTYGEQNSARLCKVTCEEGVMYDLGMDVSFKVIL